MEVGKPARAGEELVMWLLRVVERADARAQFICEYQWRQLHTLVHSMLVLAAILYIKRCVGHTWFTLHVVSTLAVTWEHFYLEWLPGLRGLRKGRGEDRSINV